MPEAIIQVDEDLRPAYYDDFRCLAEECKISCCKDWNVSFSKKDYLSLKRQEGSPKLNALLESGVRRIRKSSRADQFYGEINMDSGVCPLLREDCLCSLQKEKGHSALPHICRVFPRSEEYLSSGYLERSLSPSCEGMLSLLWDLPEGIEFRSDPLPKAQRKRIVLGKDDKSAHNALWFSKVREWCVDLLQDRRFTLPQRIFLMGLGLKDLADGEEDMERWMERAAVLPDSVDMTDLLPTGDQELLMYLGSCVYTLMMLPSNDSNGMPVKMDLMKTLVPESQIATKNFTTSLAPYLEARARYEERFGGRDYFMENLMVSIFFYLHLPQMYPRENLWKEYVNFCNLYASYRFLSVMSCRKGAPGDRGELFRLMVFASRALIHNGRRQTRLRDELFKNDSATLAHMAILLCG